MTTGIRMNHDIATLNSTTFANITTGGRYGRHRRPNGVSLCVVSSIYLPTANHQPVLTVPCSRTVDVPFPTSRLATVALRALGVDKELSPLVRRTLSTVAAIDGVDAQDSENILRVKYIATTNRMLRVAVNGFMESLALVLEVMEKLDEDVLDAHKGENGD